MESGMLRESAKKLGVTGSEAAVLQQKDPWVVELRDVIVRIVKTAKPRRLILFGSCVHGERSRGSDLDLLVIMRGLVHRRDLAAMIYRNLHGVPVPVDVIVMTEDDILQFGSKPGTVLYPALKEGIVVYEA
jgi:predicted nucleotidyltransferase